MFFDAPKIRNFKTVLCGLRFLPLVILLLRLAPCDAQTGPAGIQNSATCVFWVKADAGTSSTVNATAISFWNDQSGNSVNVTQASSAAQPSFASSIINGFPAIQFDNNNGNNDKISAPDNSILDNTSGYSFFTVTRPQVLDGNARCVVSKRTNVGVDQSFMHFYYTGNNFFTDIQTTNDRYNTGASFNINTNYLITQQYDGTLAAASRCRTYIASALNVTSSETSSLVPDNNSPLILGSTDANDPRPYGGYIAEVIIYRTALTTAPRAIVENYLSAKYNIAMSANDKYAGDNSGNGDYDLEVAGVGQESTGSSNSFSPSIAGGLGYTAISGLDNGDYLMAGHATLVNSVLTTDVAGFTGTNKSRWQRIWYIDVTNSSSALIGNLTFDFSDAGLPSPTLGLAQDYVLLFRSGTSGNWTELSTATTVSGDQIRFDSQTISTDGYYTLGTKNFFASPLPITLAKFEAVVKESFIEIEWKTELEKEVKLFELQSADNSGDFNAFETVAPRGAENKTQNYVVTDYRALNGTRYYRLKTINNDGTFEYSPIRAAGQQWQGLQVFPKPAEDVVEIKGLQVAELKLQLIDAAGTFYADETTLLIGTKTSAKLDVSSLPSGTYFLRIQYRGQLRVEKIPIK